MSVVQFNLLPDVKLEFNRSQRAKRIIYTISVLMVSIVLVIFVLSFLAVDVVQKKVLNDASNDINSYSRKLKSTTDLDKILTIQNQLSSLPSLQQQKHYASRLFAYLPQLTPTKVNIGKLDIDTSANTIHFEGTADSILTINTFVDTLKFTSYTIGTDQSTKQPAFNDVVLTKVDRNVTISSYTIDANFDPNLFLGSQSVNLIVPQETTTRSVINAPTPIFNGQTGPKSSSQQGGQ